MLKLIIEKELREIIGTTKFAVTFAVCALLILLAFYVGARNYEVSMREYEAAKAENIKGMEGLTDWSRVDNRIFLQPRPLAALVSGVSNDVGRNVEVRTRGELRAENSRFNEDPIFAIFRFLDLEFIFTVVLSLFAILFAYDAINGEKERGTLRLSFANSIPRDKYILGKLIGAFISLTVPLLITILIGCLMLPLFGVPMDAESWTRLGMVVLAGMLYLGVFLALSVFVSALTQKSANSFLLMLVIWIFSVLIIPRTAVLVAGRSVDVPSVDQINYEKNKYNSQLWQEDREKMNNYWRDNPMDSEGDMQGQMTKFRAFMSSLSEERDEKSREFGGRLNEDRRNKEAIQQKIALGFARLSPTAAFSLASTNLAGTSLDLKQQYNEQANAYQKAYASFIQEKTGSADTGFMIRIGGRSDEQEPEEIDPYELPVFEYVEPEASVYIGAALTDLGLLALFNVVFFAGAFVAFLKYDVR